MSNMGSHEWAPWYNYTEEQKLIEVFSEKVPVYLLVFLFL
jgi:hypothetical protein